MTNVSLYNTDIHAFEQQALEYMIQHDFNVLEVPVLQNADIILDTIGERARAELFFVESIDANQNALRYDFTLAIARYYLEHILPKDKNPQKFATCGTVFRNRGQNSTQPSEIKQINFEYIGDNDRLRADASCLAQALDLLNPYIKDTLHIGIADIRLSKAVLSGDFIPPIKAGRLKNALRHPKKFMSILNKSTSDSQSSLASLGKLSPSDANAVIHDIFTMTGLKHSGLRTLEEISTRFITKTAEQSEMKLDDHIIQTLTEFYHLECPAVMMCDKMRQIMQNMDINIDDYLQYFERRLDFLRTYNVDMSRLQYGALLNRKPEYYTGFMFSLEVVGQDKNQTIGGGGRYDGLFKQLGHSEKIYAIGCEIRSESVMML
jgi:ATP phosphoribosyltransferase regulatory subunit